MICYAAECLTQVGCWVFAGEAGATKQAGSDIVRKLIGLDLNQPKSDPRYRVSGYTPCTLGQELTGPARCLALECRTQQGQWKFGGQVTPATDPGRAAEILKVAVNGDTSHPRNDPRYRTSLYVRTARAL